MAPKNMYDKRVPMRVLWKAGGQAGRQAGRRAGRRTGVNKHSTRAHVRVRVFVCVYVRACMRLECVYVRVCVFVRVHVTSLTRAAVEVEGNSRNSHRSYFHLLTLLRRCFSARDVRPLKTDRRDSSIRFSSSKALKVGQQQGGMLCSGICQNCSSFLMNGPQRSRGRCSSPVL